jgi:septum formation protein
MGAPSNSTKLILASASPRRLTLLQQIGMAPDDVIPADVDETPLKAEEPRAYAARVTHDKAVVIANAHVDDFVLAADTVVACGRRILPKTETEDEAIACLQLLSGRSHRVYTAIALFGPGDARRERLVETRVKVRRLSEQDVAAYVATDEWRGKAGGYAIQGAFARHIISIIGSYTNVVGLPLYETANLIDGAGWKRA